VVSKAPLWVKNGPCYLSKNDKFGIEWANGYALFCVFGRYRYLCQKADRSQYIVRRGVRLRMHELKLQLDKSEFLRKEVNYLGHQITETGVSPDPQM